MDVTSRTRALYAYDASNYRVVPLAVAFPRTTAEVSALVSAAARHRVAVTTRGAGTSMAGNAVGPGLVLDVSRHLNQVLDIDVATGTAWVQPGIVIDDLQRRLRPLGLMFAPDPSSKSRATVGGAIGNDACGNHSVKYGRTSHHVVALELVLADGLQVLAEAGGFRASQAGDTRAAARADELNRGLRRLVAENLGPIRLQLGRTARQVSGFQLHHLLPENGFDVAKAMAGTEGACAIVVAAEVALVPVPRCSRLLVLGYRSAVEAARDVPEVLGHAPAAVEGIEERIVTAMRLRRGAASVSALPDGSAWMFIELEDDDEDSVATRAQALESRLRAVGRVLDLRVVDDPEQRAALWRVREDGAGLLTRPPEGGQTWPGWEDSAVPPDHLADYLSDLRDLLDQHELQSVFYGHFGAGCVHMRVDFDLTTAEGVAVMVDFTDAAARLVCAYGGSISGEHGDGRARSDLLALQYGAEVLAAFSTFKSAFDPDGRLNPGIIVSPSPRQDDLALLQLAPFDASATAFDFPHDPGGFAEAAQRCVGIGRCRADLPAAGGHSMCPSFRATHDEKDSTRGRARALQEMVAGDLVTTGWRSPEVRDALDFCLSCKACATDCPVGVDMATYKAEFLHHHYRRRLRPLSHYSLGWLPVLSAVVGPFSGLVNRLLAIPPLRRLAARLGGVTPHRSVPTFHAAGAVARARGTADGGLESADVVVFTDTFTRAFRPELAGATDRVLAATGARPHHVDGHCCGLTWISTGQLSVARRVLRRTVRALAATGDRPIVVMEPSCASALRSDAPELLGTEEARRVAERIITVPGHVENSLDAGWSPPPLGDDVLLQTHCHDYATFGATSQTRVLERLGVSRVESAQGCCGLAGNFGFESEHYEVSMAVADLSLRPLLEAAAPDVPVVADGFSCQTQIQHLSDARPRHLAQLLDDALSRRAPAPPQPRPTTAPQKESA